MALKFGNVENLRCLTDVGVTGPAGEQLCIGHKYTIHWWGAGGYVSDEGLVLGVKGKDAYFEMPTGEELAGLQSEGLMPKAMPTYSIPTIDLVFGYSLWPLLAIAAVIGYISHKKSKRERAEDEVAPIDLGGPKLVNKIDRQIAEAFAKLAHPGEVVSHQAAATNKHTSAWNPQPYFAFLTEQRLVLVTTKRGFGFLGLFHKAGVVSEFPRTTLRPVKVADELITLDAGGQTVTLFVPRAWYGASNQRAFLRDVPRLLSGQRVALAGGFDDALAVGLKP